jgi:hypothetical protein
VTSAPDEEKGSFATQKAGDYCDYDPFQGINLLNPATDGKCGTGGRPQLIRKQYASGPLSSLSAQSMEQGMM